ncbi:tautomerase family protein [Candidatus Formimonas warabiya]|uniref:4-oxalocrotonate tautomerase-like domain-containing protein n=1 Tax=Formimonas warabiya TaxID=1761012 RepID=A0A3G1KZ18_FORW1|nr:4-oxalocrotonate tautomerase family protein [Candidatus Formimonas warabiya]ATW27704.1 hypothetical protein DCMF_25750 [Candidatus Formimonas warabiya]
MPFINVRIFEGHSKERKARIAEKITEIVNQETGVPKEYIWVTFQDIPADEWSIGGKMCGKSE